MVEVDIKAISTIARAVDKAGNTNKEIDTDEEKSLFCTKLVQKGYFSSEEEVKKIIKNYSTNINYYESLFIQNSSKKNDNKEYAVYAALNRNSILNKNSDEDITSIAKALNHSNIIDQPSELDKINENNVYEVLKQAGSKINVKHNWFDSGISEDIRKNIIISLAKFALNQGIDISDILDDDLNVTNLKVKDKDESAYDEDNFITVKNALMKLIEEHAKEYTEKPETKSGIVNKINLFATDVDAAGNQNNYVDGDEISEFKSMCANVGIYIDEYLSENSSNKDDLEFKEVKAAIKHVFETSTNLTEEGRSRKEIQALLNMIENSPKLVKHTTALAPNTFGYVPITTVSENEINISDSIAESINENNIEEILETLSKKNLTISNKQVLQTLANIAKEYNISVKESGGKYYIKYNDETKTVLNSEIGTALNTIREFINKAKEDEKEIFADN